MSEPQLFNYYNEKLNYLKLNNIRLLSADYGNLNGKVDRTHFILEIKGGNNGNGKWIDYLEQIKKILQFFPDSWIINLDVDCPDDIWYLKMGINKYLM